MNQYNYLIVGSGLFGTTMAYLLHQKGYKCLVIDKRPHIGGNVYTESVNGINVHKYGAHIFHTSDRRVWEFVNSFVEFNRYTNSPVAKYKGKLYNLPFNMNTFYQMWGVTTPEKAKEMIEKQRKESGIINPQNLEEQAISLIGKDIYYTLIKIIPRSNGGVNLRNFLRLSSNDFLCVSLSIIIISTINIKVSRRADTRG